MLVKNLFKNNLMGKRIKTLITSAGSTNGINVIKALKNQNELSISLIAVDINSLAAGFLYG